MTKTPLTVKALSVADSWKDIARVPHKYRRDVNDKPIRRGTICRVVIDGKETLLAVRGSDDPEAKIFLDSPTRIELAVEVENVRNVELLPTTWFGSFRWAWRADDPAYRLPAQISLISLALGIIGLFLGLWPIIHDACQKLPNK